MEFAFGAALLFSISSVSGRQGVLHLGPARTNFTRQILALVLLGLYAHLIGGGFHGPALGWFIFSGFIGYGIGDTSIYSALPLLGSRLTSLMTQCLAAPIGALIEWAWHGTLLRPEQSIACLIILAGVALALAPNRGAAPTQRLPTKGVVYGVLAAVGQAGGAVFSRHGSKVSALAGMPVDGITVAYQRIWPGLLVGGLWYWFHRRSSPAGPTDTSKPSEKSPWQKAWPWIVLNAIAGPTLGVSCYQRALQLEPTAIVLPIVALSPLLVIPLAWFMEGERPTFRSLAGGIIAVA
ncbi:MAG TPA: DMT family transporter, partial [Candidatus Limnocylindria bacterium]|nr:DMT family transporter [Candidatus Limnocylindria bacterium]